MKSKENNKVAPLTAGQIGCTPEGLGWAAVLAQRGIQVYCTDPDEEVVNGVIDGVMPGEMPGLPEMVRQGVEGGNLVLLGNPRKIFKNCRVIFINSIMPKGEDDLPQLRFIETLVRQAAYQISEDTLLVIRSLLPEKDITYLQKKADRLTEEREDKVKIQICVMPDYRVAGDWLKKIATIEILAVGCEDEIPAALLDLLMQLPSAQRRIRTCSIGEAVMSAYGYNGLTAIRQTYFEELMRLCLKTEVSPQKVLSLIEDLPCADSGFDNIGAGYGGTLLAHRLDHLVALGKKEGVPQSLCTQTVRDRDRNTLTLIARLKESMQPSGKTIAVMGLAANGNTDDLRETPALDVVKALMDSGAEIRLFMPCGMDQAKWRFFKDREKMTFCDSVIEATKKADTLLVLGKWKGMQRLLTKGLGKRMAGNQFFDIVCAFEAEKVEKLGLSYYN